MDKNLILRRVKSVVSSIAPEATVILYGSVARGNDTKDSDIDILVLLERNNLSRKDKKSIKYSLYDIEFETGTIISTLVFSKKEWESKHKKTPFYENIARDGIKI